MNTVAHISIMTRTIFSIVIMAMVIFQLWSFSKVPYRETVGYFLLDTTNWGVTLGQAEKHAFYLFSPLNDSFVAKNGTRSYLTSHARFSNSTNFQKFTDQFYPVIARIPYISHGVKISLHDPEITYSLTTDKDIVLVNRTIERLPETTKELRFTMTYSRDDILFDRHGTLYTDSPDDEIQMISSLFGISLNKPKKTSSRLPLSSQSVLIVNPRIPGILEVKRDSNQIITIDKDNHRIEIDQPITSVEKQSYTQSIFTYKSASDAMKKIP